MICRPSNIADEIAAVEIRAAMRGKRCWYAFLGIGCTFAMELGRKVPRDAKDIAHLERVKQRYAKKGILDSWHPDEYLKYQGEGHLLVWCSWRIDSEEGPLASSDNEHDQCESAVKRLIGKTVQEVRIGERWDMRLVLSSGLTVTVFPNYVGPNADFDGNWELWGLEKSYLIGTDFTCEVVGRESSSVSAPRQGRKWATREKPSPRKAAAVGK